MEGTLVPSCACYILIVPFCIALFYIIYSLFYLSPKYRSSLQSIQLLIAVKSTLLVRYGADRILQPFLEEVKQLDFQDISQHLHVCVCMHVYVYVCVTLFSHQI